MSYKFLEHTTDAFIEVRAPTLKEAFIQAGNAVVDTTLDQVSIKETEQKKLFVSGEKLHNLLFNWLEEVNYQIITEGFAIARFCINISKNSQYNLEATVYGEKIDLEKHHFKMEIKAPTYHLMEITEGKDIIMRFLLDL